MHYMYMPQSLRGYMIQLILFLSYSWESLMTSQLLNGILLMKIFLLEAAWMGKLWFGILVRSLRNSWSKSAFGTIPLSCRNKQTNYISKMDLYPSCIGVLNQSLQSKYCLVLLGSGRIWQFWLANAKLPNFIIKMNIGTERISWYFVNWLSARHINVWSLKVFFLFTLHLQYFY